MSTVKKPLKYLWVAHFEDGHTIKQPEDDHYSKHDDNAEWNPSSFRDILDYQEKSPVISFTLYRPGETFTVYLKTGQFSSNGKLFELGPSSPPRKLVYYRNVEQKYVDGIAQEPEIVAYCMGFEFKDENGKNKTRILNIDG